jgi:hypothetical protein
LADETDLARFDPKAKLPRRSFIMSPEQLRAEKGESYWLGFDHGQEVARITLRQEIADELQDEMERFDPDCALCTARRTEKKLRRDLAEARLVKRPIPY